MQLDFRTKFLMTLVIITISISGVFIATLPFLAFGISALPFLFLLHTGKYRMAIQGLILVSVALFCKLFLKVETMNILVSALLAFSYIMLAILPGIMMGYYALTTTTMSDLVCSLRRMRVPDALLIPISVMFRFFYSIREDYGQINNAMKMHGLTLRSAFQQPMRFFEYKLVPLLMVSMQAADDVAISAMTRGMEVGQERSTISTARLRVQDYITLLLLGMLIILYIKVKYA